MKKQTLLAFVTTVTLSLFASTSIASQADELRERAKALHKEAAVLAERGEKGRSNELKQKAEELLHRAEKESNSQNENSKKGDDDILKLATKLRSLREMFERRQREGASEIDVQRVEKELKATAEKLSALKKEGRGNQAPPPEMKLQIEKIERASKQVKHIRQAAEHLKMAEIHDMAEKFMARADEMEREIRKAKERMGAVETEKREKEMYGKETPAMQDIVRELRAEIEGLRDEVKALKAQLKKD
jgi:hypothetical protein